MTAAADSAGQMPGYWMYETSGVLRPVIEAYLNGEPMSPEQVAAMRAYLRQWVMAPVWDSNPHSDFGDKFRLAFLRERINFLTSRSTIEEWIADAIGMGMDPL